MKKIFSCLMIFLVVFSFSVHTLLGGPASNKELRSKITAEYKVDHEGIVDSLEPLKFNSHNANFIAGFVNQALFEKPFQGYKMDRAKITKEIVTSLVNDNFLNLREPERIKLFLRALAEHVPGSGFLTRGEDKQKYQDFINEPATVFDFEKAPGITYVKLDFFKESGFYLDFQDHMLSLAKSRLCFSKFIFDLRGNTDGSMEIAVSMVELLNKVRYEELEYKEKPANLPSKWSRLMMPPKLMYRKALRPMDSVSLYIASDFYTFLNPLFRHYVEDDYRGGIDFRGDQYTNGNGEIVHYRYVDVRNKNLKKFKESIREFNELMDSYEIVIMVDGDTAGPAELFTALMVHNNPNVIILGEPTKGDITSGTVYTLVYDLELNRMDTLEGHKKNCRTRKPKDDSNSGGFGGRRVSYTIANSRGSHDHIIDIGTLKLTDSYWLNLLFGDYHIQSIHEGGISPHYLYNLLDNTPEKQLQSAIELLK